MRRTVHSVFLNTVQPLLCQAIAGWHPGKFASRGHAPPSPPETLGTATGEACTRRNRGDMVAKECATEQRLGAEMHTKGASCWLLGPARARAGGTSWGATLALGFPRPPSRRSVSPPLPPPGLRRGSPLASTPRPGPVPLSSFLLGTALCPHMESSVDSPFTSSHP